MNSDSGDDERNPKQLCGGRDLVQHDDPNADAVAGNSEKSSAKLARDNLAMASWSPT